MGTVKRGVLNVLRNPIRMVIIVLLLGLCLMFVAAMVEMNASVQDRLTQLSGQIGTTITISPAGSFGPFGGGSSGSTSTLSDSQVTQVKNTPGVARVETSVTQFYSGSEIKSATVSTSQSGSDGAPPGGGSGGFQSGPLVYGTSGSLSNVSFFGGSTATLAAGRNLSTSDANANVALMSQAIAQANNLSVGDTFTFQGTTLTLVGLYNTGTGFSDNSVVLPIKTAERLFSLSGVTSITAYASTVNAVEGVASKLRSELGSAVSVVTQQDIIATTTSALSGTANSIKGILIVSVAVAALVIIFAVFLIVRERTQEIGILKAIGASNTRVIGQFAAEILTLSIFASGVATVLLVLLGQPLASIFSIVSSGSGGSRLGSGDGGGFVRLGDGGTFGNPLNTQLTPESLLVLLGLGVLLAVVASTVPAWYVARLQPARVLRQAVA